MINILLDVLCVFTFCTPQMWQTTLKIALKTLKNKLESDLKSTTNVWIEIPLEAWLICRYGVGLFLSRP
jgi:hypothetical protein